MEKSPKKESKNKKRLSKRKESTTNNSDSSGNGYYGQTMDGYEWVEDSPPKPDHDWRSHN